MKTPTFRCLALMVFLMGCKQPLITFAESQPHNKTALKAIPEKFRGNYFNPVDSTYLSVSNDVIRKIFRDSDTIPTQEFIDTIFAISSGDEVKRFRGSYFLNIQRAADDWEVRRMRFKNGVLQINEISSAEEIKNLETITESARDTVTPFKVRPTTKQFSAFLKANGFSTGEQYIRLN